MVQDSYKMGEGGKRIIVMLIIVQGVNYRCEDGRFLVSAICVTTSNLDLLSSLKTGCDQVM
jgi:hypothetical protein